MAEKQADKGMTFEKALARLETLVGDMESGKLSLEKMMACFEEGTTLVRFCTQKLNEVEKKVEMLVKKGDKLVTEPFDAAEDGPGAGRA
ncbi:MAG TPA: exodeoxyribonuclease VII small subunit [Kiritimatiellia bacterium]|nr:exodeoxyribonuclease VII small subunit [Kiritimatiellia bacterium]